MEPGDVLALRMGAGEMGDDRVEVEPLRVDRLAAGQRQHLRAHQRARMKADRAGLDEAQRAQGEKVRRARSRADEVDRHGGALGAFETLLQGCP